MELTTLAAQIRANLYRVEEKAAAAAMRCGRAPEEIRIVVVSKGQPLEVIEAAVQAGAVTFGENYAEQAAPKIEALAGNEGLRWHMIGHIQSRKADLVCSHFHYVHSLDSVKLAEKLNQRCGELAKVMPVLLELNLAGEESKSGWVIHKTSDLAGLLPDIERITELPNLEIQGLMTMPPLFEDPVRNRPYFALLGQCAGELRSRFPNQKWGELSMGTSADYETAIEEGATMIRVGQAVLGPRPPRR